jgi:hypothetical protein
LPGGPNYSFTEFSGGWGSILDQLERVVDERVRAEREALP